MKDGSRKPMIFCPALCVQFFPQIGDRNGQVIDFKGPQIPFIPIAYTAGLFGIVPLF